MGVLLFVAACDSTISPPIDPQVTPYHAAGSASESTESNVVLIWGEACLQSIRDTRQGPPMTARTLGIVHTAMYDAWAAYDAAAIGTRLGGLLRRPVEERTIANKAEAISHAAYRTLVDLFPGRIDVYRGIMESLGYDSSVTTTDGTTAPEIGNAAAEALLSFRHHDGSNQLAGYADYTDYVPVNPPWDPTDSGVGTLVDPTKWQPLLHNEIVQQWIIPHWEFVAPFALTSANQFIPPPPAPEKSGEWHRQVQEVINIQAKLTDEQKVVAEYWADGPSSEFPPGHWCTIAQYVSQRDGHTLDDDVKMFFLVANAVFDASIAAWTAKIRYDYVRPVTAVRYVKRGKKIRAWAGPGLGTRVIDGDTWLPYQISTFRTPPFSEYISGHSTFSMAGATVLRRFKGSDEYGDCASFPAGWSKVEPGFAPSDDVTLCWETFTEAAEQAGISRLYGGIHFRQGNLEGLNVGRQVGEQVWAKAQTYFNGTAEAL